MQNIGDIFTRAGIRAINVGQVLSFMKDGQKKSFKVVKRHVKRQELWVRPVTLYRPDEVEIVDKVEQ